MLIYTGIFTIERLCMVAYKKRIEAKYKLVARIPERLLSFTVPVRKKAIGYLNLAQGSSVIDVGCGTGASFQYIQDVVGEGGKILGVEPSKSMITIARERVMRKGWSNIVLQEVTIEEVETKELFDGALLFAMQDVFNSMEGIEKIHAMLKDGARIVCAGPKLQEKGPLKILNPILNILFKRLAISQDNKDKPWRLVERVFIAEQIVEVMHGMIFIYVGRK